MSQESRNFGNKVVDMFERMFNQEQALVAA